MTTRGPGRATDLYRLLQVDPEADVEIIGAAYRKLAQRYHPDVTSDPSAAARMAAINAAWEVLRDPAKRAAYDRERRFGTYGDDGSTTRRPANAPATPGSTRARGASTAPGGWAQEGRAGGSGASASTGSGEKWRAGSAAGTGGTADDRAGPPPGAPSGSVITFGRYRGWSLGQIARYDLSFVEWLERAPAGRQYQTEIAAILRRYGRR